MTFQVVLQHFGRIPLPLLFLPAFAIHAGTALLRLNSFFPRPQALDFSSYYVGAWALRTGISPYQFPPSFLEPLQIAQQIPPGIPGHNSPPLWAALLQPLTWLDFPAAAVIWLLLLLCLSLWSHNQLATIAVGRSNWLMLPLTLTFGPLFLNLTLGQNGVVLLAAALLIATQLDKPKQTPWAAIALTVAVAAKLYPALWFALFPAARRWRAAAQIALGGSAAFALIFLLYPAANWDYWLRYLPAQSGGFAKNVNIDDQSIGAWLLRIGRSNQFTFPGLSTSDLQIITVSFPWELSSQFIQLVAYSILLLLFGAIIYAAWRRNHMQGVTMSGLFFALVLFSVMVFPHMARYNHILLLPSMAWLWKNGGDFGRKVTILAYFFAALSRLNHLIAILLPPPLAAFASGFGLHAALLLLVATLYIVQTKSDGPKPIAM